MVRSGGRAFHGRARSAYQAKPGIEAANGGDDGVGKLHIVLRLVVESPVRLDVVEHRALRPSNRIQRAELIDDKLDHLRVRQLLPPPTEAFSIVEARMGTDG